MLQKRTENRGLRRVLGALVGLAMVALTAPMARSQQPGADFQAQLAAGEFAPALQAAQQAANPQQRDAALAQVAAAQAQAGAPAAAVATVAQIGDDRARAHILAQQAGGAAGPAGGQGQNGQNNNLANFQPLMDLIQNTVSTKSWIDNGGNGTISDFPTGVSVDPTGVLRPLMQEAQSSDLAVLRSASRQAQRRTMFRRSSPLRMVSLTRLEKQIELNAALGQAPDEPMKYLAGLRRIQYIFVYPDTGDLVIAGPAGDWAAGSENRIVSVDTGDPVVRLDDLVVVFRHMMQSPNAYFGCKIDPRQDGLTRAEEFTKQMRGRKLPEGDAVRREYCRQLAAALGKQDIEVFGGLDPETRAARTLVEADYRMKLVGMGLEPGVPGLTSYMSLIKSPPKSVDMLRWWFTLNYDSVQTSQDHLAFNIRGQGVKVESENEHLDPGGQRVHTGKSDPLNRQFVESFTKHFDELCAKYPIYAELRNICDLALAASLVREEALADKVGWHMAWFGDPQAFAVEKCAAPKEVDSVVNYRPLNGGVFVVQVSGGVAVKTSELVSRKAVQVESSPQLQQQRPHSAAKPQAAGRWWWD